LHELGIEKPVKRYAALVIWPKVVGERISSVTEPLSISNGTILVRVKSAVWRNELVYYKAEIIRKMNQELGTSVINDIVLI
jgi:predicted nucleic acid-binding Zn ribbon protein